jgi:hypothetical protein
VTIAIAFVCALLVAGCAHHSDARSCVDLSGSHIQPDWLVRRITVDEAERAHMYRGIPFGYQNEQWQALRQQMRRGDDLWFYRRKYPPLPPDWKGVVVGAEEGYVLVRGCTIVDSIVTLVS